LQTLLHGYEWARNTVGQSGSEVYRLHRRGSPSLYLKCGRGSVAIDIADEMMRLRWLAGRVPVPEARHFVASTHEAWLLMTELPGRTATQAFCGSGVDPLAIVDALSDFLRRFHSLPTEACPFKSDHHLRMIQARERLDAGLIDCDDFDDEHLGWPAGKVWAELVGLLPISFDAVVTHGDFSLDNVLMEGDKVVGVIDVARMGVADRYQDLAILWRDIGKLDETLRRRFFSHYGIASLDERKLRFHVTLDECF